MIDYLIRPLQPPSKKRYFMLLTAKMKRDENEHENHTRYSKNEKVATEFSNISLSKDGSREQKYEACESIEGSKTSNPASIKATEFSNSPRKSAPGEGFEPSRPSRATSFIVANFQACALPG